MKYQPVDILKVYFWHESKKNLLGRLALKNRRIWFEYNAEFLKLGIEVSPFKLPLKSGAIVCEDQVFEGIFGLFNDSLPDGWGKLLLDRQLRRWDILPQQFSVLDRLACVGSHGMGALSYEPEFLLSKDQYKNLSLTKLAEGARLVLEGTGEDFFSELLSLNGSSAGARPKIMVQVDEKKSRIIHGADKLKKGLEYWIIKFSSSHDPTDMGAIEFTYSLMAKATGIDMPETYLFPIKNKSGFFATKRFDRFKNKRIHMHTLCGLIHADHRIPNLDYDMLLKVTRVLTRNMQELEKVFRLACFNVLAHNRDDHSKNFSFILNEENQWKISPAYDLTFSYGPGGEQSMTVMGEGKNPSSILLQKLGKKYDIKKAEMIIDEVKTMVKKWSDYAKKNGVSQKSAKIIKDHLDKID